SVFGRKMSVSGQFCPKTPFYKKLMKPSKACFSWLSMAGCRLCRHPETAVQRRGSFYGRTTRQEEIL
ncbi:MAG: hypothetical protein IJQ33_12520, partial [Clostridia bacterium]|nr:hypothetical protein [Clostridia bacterium]